VVTNIRFDRSQSLVASLATNFPISMAMPVGQHIEPLGTTMVILPGTLVRMAIIVVGKALVRMGMVIITANRFS